MNNLRAYLAIALLSAQCSSATAIASETGARAKLETALSCHGSAKSHDLTGWITSMGGGSIVESASLDAGAEYTLPNPLYVLGFPATRVNVRVLRGHDQTFSVYETILPDTSFRSIASIAGLSADDAGNFQQRVGKNHLFLREQSGVTYITCAMGIHRPGLERALHAPDQAEIQHRNAGGKDARLQ